MAGLGGTARGDSYRVVAELNREWTSLREHCTETRAWSDRHAVLRDADDLGDVLDLVPRYPDEVLGALIQESSAGSVLAARTVLQAMLGKVVLMAAAEPAVGIHDFLVAMWDRIRTYPIERRPRHIPANLALDARKWARREQRETFLAKPWPPGDAFSAIVDRRRELESVDHARDLALMTAGDVIRAALELELIDSAAGGLLETVYGDGLTSTEAAHLHKMSPATVRRRCSQVVKELARHSAELADIA